MKIEIYVIFYYDYQNDKYIEIQTSRNYQIAKKSFDLITDKYPNEFYILTKVLRC